MHHLTNYESFIIILPSLGFSEFLIGIFGFLWSDLTTIAWRFQYLSGSIYWKYSNLDNILFSSQQTSFIRVWALNKEIQMDKCNHIIDFHRLSYTTIGYHRQSLTIIGYHWLSLAIIGYHWLSLTIVDYDRDHWLSLTIIDYHWLSLTIIDYHWLS